MTHKIFLRCILFRKLLVVDISHLMQSSSILLMLISQSCTNYAKDFKKGISRCTLVNSTNTSVDLTKDKKSDRQESDAMKSILLAN